MRSRNRAIAVVVSLLRSGRGVRWRVTGHSMKPLLPPGCLLRIEPVTGAPRIGDVVLYQADGGKLISHRVVATPSDGVRTKGDALLHPDGAVQAERILGKVVAVEEPFRLSLEGRIMRGVGRLAGWVYPRLYQIKSALRRGLVFRPHRARGAADV